MSSGLNLYKPFVNNEGFVQKPKECIYCSLQGKVGFVPDGMMDDTDLTADKIKGLKALSMCEMPSKDEAMGFSPLSGGYGWARWARWWEKTGWQKDEVGFLFLRRCYAGLYQGRIMAKAAEIADGNKKCRRYDVLLEKFRPDVALITNDYEDVMATPAYYRLMLADLKKMRELVEKGRRPLLLMGKEPMTHFLPSLGGNIKKWGGSWFDL